MNRGSVRVVNFASSFSWSSGRSGASNNSGAASGPTYERVLRYPDGLVRRIRYPIPLESATATTDVALDVSEDWETRNAWKAQTQQPLHPSSLTSGQVSTKHTRVLAFMDYRASCTAARFSVASHNKGCVLFLVVAGCEKPNPRIHTTKTRCWSTNT